MNQPASGVRPGTVLLAPPDAGERADDVLCVFDIDPAEPGACFALLLNRPTPAPAQPLVFSLFDCGDDTAWWGGPTGEPFALVELAGRPEVDRQRPDGSPRRFLTRGSALFTPGRDHAPSRPPRRVRVFQGSMWLSPHDVERFAREGVIVAATDDMLFDAHPDTLAERLRAQHDGSTTTIHARNEMSATPANAGPMIYDRRAPKSLIEALAPGGLMHELVQLVLDDRTEGLDLQLRADPRRPYVGRATLYIGLTKVVDVEVGRTGKFKLTAQTGRSFAKLGLDPTLFKPQWRESQQPEQLQAEWQQIMAYVRRAIACAPADKVKKEGMLQAALTRPSDGSFELVDREAVIAFSSQHEKDAALKRLRQPISAAVDDVRRRHPDWAREKRFGDELDAIAIDRDGRVLIIEAKHESDTTGLGWTPAQVALYLTLFDHWAQQDPVQAQRVLSGMLEQRRLIGLPSVVPVPIDDPLRFVPVIAVAGEIGSVPLGRMRIPVLNLWCPARATVRVGSKVEPRSDPKCDLTSRRRVSFGRSVGLGSCLRGSA